MCPEACEGVDEEFGGSYDVELIAAGSGASLPEGTNPLMHGRAVELVASGHLALAPLVTRRLALEEVPPALTAPPEPGDVKTIVLP